MQPLNVYVSDIAAVWGADADRIVNEYRDAFKSRDDVLRDLAGFARVGTTASDEELVRIEGRREMFWRIMGLIEGDPLRVAQFLEGATLD